MALDPPRLARSEKDGATARDGARHPSVRALLGVVGQTDAEAAIRARAIALVDELRGFADWEGPPFDMEALASFRGFRVRYSDGFSRRQDACITPGLIAINRQKPRRRQRYSVAHEIIHTLFPDYEAELRRAGALWRDESPAGAAASDPYEAELEHLCQVGAAELLLPRFAFQPELQALGLSLETAIALSERFDASLEATTRRAVELTPAPALAVFVEPSGRDMSRESRPADYSPFAQLAVARMAVSPSADGFGVARGARVPPTSVIHKAWKRASYPPAAADIYTADETWPLRDGADVLVRCSAMVLPRRSRTPCEVLALVAIQ